VVRGRAIVIAAAALALATGTAGASTAAVTPSNTALPTISGTAAQGQTLTTTSGGWTGDNPITFAYKWERCDANGANCVAISGAAAQDYTLTLADVKSTIRSLVTAANAGGSASKESAQTAKVTGASPPANTALPTIGGAASVGSTITAANGTWTGSAPITYAYQWRRCDSTGGACASISGATQSTYAVTTADVQHTLKVTVTATNAGGSAQATSAQTGLVQQGVPANTAMPAISGSTTQGQSLTVSNGTWTGAAPIAYAYSWERCDANGASCAAISGETKATYVLAAADVGSKLRAKVTASNGSGGYTVETAAVGPVVSGLPTGAVKLADGEISVPASSVPDTDRLLISTVSYSPGAIHGNAPVTMKVKIVDANKYVISGALVYVLAVPSSWAAKTDETPTAQDGTATVTLQTTSKAPKTGSLVLFVRARTPEGNVLAGSSTRRLVSVRIAR
jgi:hypothetical protein